MKLWQLQPFHVIFDHYVPKHICEIGTHHGRSACQFIQYLAPRVDALNYQGYDLFDDADPDITRREHNGKGPGSFRRAQRSLDKMTALFPNLKYQLVQGNTTQTLTQLYAYDFVYIDGGHSYETVRHDFEMVKGSTAIVFDDYQIEGVRQAVDEIATKESDYVTVRLPTRLQRLKRQQVAMFWRHDVRTTDLLLTSLSSLSR